MTAEQNPNLQEFLNFVNSSVMSANTIRTANQIAAEQAKQARLAAEEVAKKQAEEAEQQRVIRIEGRKDWVSRVVDMMHIKEKLQAMDERVWDKKGAMSSTGVGYGGDDVVSTQLRLSFEAGTAQEHISEGFAGHITPKDRPYGYGPHQLGLYRSYSKGIVRSDIQISIASRDISQWIKHDAGYSYSPPKLLTFDQPQPIDGVVAVSLYSDALSNKFKVSNKDRIVDSSEKPIIQERFPTIFNHLNSPGSLRKDGVYLDVAGGFSMVESFLNEFLALDCFVRIRDRQTPSMLDPEGQRLFSSLSQDVLNRRTLIRLIGTEDCTCTPGEPG